MQWRQFQKTVSSQFKKTPDCWNPHFHFPQSSKQHCSCTALWQRTELLRLSTPHTLSSPWQIYDKVYSPLEMVSIVCITYHLLVSILAFFLTTFQMHHNGRAGDEKLPKHIRKYILRYVTLWLVVLKSHNVMQCNVCNVLQHFFHDSKASCFKWPWHSPQCWSKRDTWSCCCTRWLSANPKIFGI